MKHRFLISFLCLLLLPQSWKISQAYSDDQVWKIGVLLCLSGECAEEGENTLKGVRFAVDDINSQGVLGRKIVLNVQDTVEGTSGVKAVSAYRQLRTDPDMHFFIGPTWTSAALSLAPIISKDPSVIIVTATVGASEFHKSGKNIFNIRGTSEMASRKSAQYAWTKGYKTAGIFSSEQPWETAQARYFEEEFTKLGGKVLSKVEPLPTISDVSTETLKLIKAKPDMVFLASMIFMGRCARDLKRFQYHGFKMGSYIDDRRLSDAQGTLEGTEFFDIRHPTDEFSKRYLPRYGKLPVTESGTGYDAVTALAEAVKGAKSFDPEKVRSVLLKLKLNGASGPIEFDSEGCVLNEPQAWRVRGNGFERVE